MQIRNTINKSVTVATVFVSMMNNKICINVSKLATFLNVVLGTYTITAQKINEMLCMAEFQRIANDDEVKNLGTVTVKYVPTNRANDFVKMETIVRNDVEIASLIWNPLILWEILIVDFNQGIDEIVDNILFAVDDYQLINYDKDDIDIDTLKENMKYLKEEMQKVGKNE